MRPHFVRTALAAIAGGVLALASSAAFADTRVALLIGNASYSSTAALENPPNDIELMATSFRQAGFDSVQTALNLNRAGMLGALRTFEQRANGADIAVIYYSGHGMEMDGMNYLLPIDVRLATDRDVVDEAVTLERVQSSLEGVKRLRLVILDACRNNPFQATMRRTYGTRAVTRGLSRVEPGTDTLVAFAAKAGTVAQDGIGTNSPFAESLAKRLLAPGTDVQIAFRQIRDDVLDATGRQQEPFLYGSIGGSELPLSKVAALPMATAPIAAPVAAPPPPPVVAPPPAAATDDDDLIWQAVKEAGDVQLVRDFILRYPRNPNRLEAIRLLARLQSPSVPPAPAAEPPPVVMAPPVLAPVAPPKPAIVKPTIAAIPDEAPAPTRETRGQPDTRDTVIAPVVPRPVKPKPVKPARVVDAKPRPVRPAAEPAEEAKPPKVKGFGCVLAKKLPIETGYNPDAGVIRCLN